jgi:hypothetical protein
VQALRQFSPYKSAGSLQSAHGLAGVLFVSFDNDHDASGAGIGREVHFAYIRQANAGIAKFSLENGFNFLAQSLAEPFPMVLLTAPFQVNLEIKRMRISKSGLRRGI